MNRWAVSNTRRRLAAARPAVWWRRRFRVGKPSLLHKTLLKLPRAFIWDTAFALAAHCRLVAIRQCSRRTPISTLVMQPRSTTRNGETRLEGHARRRVLEFNF